MDWLAFAVAVVEIACAVVADVPSASVIEPTALLLEAFAAELCVTRRVADTGAGTALLDTPPWGPGADMAVV